jgi:LysW-gamma-L-lysine carboxypeptidase
MMENNYWMTAPEEFKTLFGLVERYSPSGSELEAVSWLITRMSALGYDRSFIDGAGNAVGVMGDGPRQLVLLGHIDTVPGEIPFSVENDILFGRGSVDAKAPLACFVDSVAKIGAVPGWQIVVIACIDEECDGMGARYVLSQYHPECVIVGEPSRWDRIALGYKGCAWASIQISSDLTHGASDKATSCEIASEIWGKIRAWCQDYNLTRPKIFDQIMFSLTNWYSGKDGFSQWARLVVSARMPPGFLPEDFYATLESIAPEADISHSAFPTPAYRGEKNSPLVRAFLPAIRANGGNPAFVYKTGTADLNLVAPAWNCPGLAYGPGDSTLDHTPNEHLDLKEFLLAEKVLVDVLNQLTGKLSTQE